MRVSLDSLEPNLDKVEFICGDIWSKKLDEEESVIGFAFVALFVEEELC